MRDQESKSVFTDHVQRTRIGPGLSLDDIRRRASRRRGARRIGLAAAAAALVVGAVALEAAFRLPSLPAITEVTPTESTVPLDESSVTMLLSPTPFPADGGLLALAVSNPTARRFDYGARGEVEIWIDGGWARLGGFSTGLSSWDGPGGVSWAGEGLPSKDILLSAPADGAGPLEWLRLPRLDPGVYRFVRGGVDDNAVTASATLVVSEESIAPGFVPPGSSPLLDISEPAVRGSQPQELRFVVTIPSTAQRTSSLPALRESASSHAEVERWTGAVWESAARSDVDKHPPKPRTNLYEWAIDLPQLPPGFFRLVLESAGGPLVGYFWVGE